jgi:alanine racemase
LVDDLPEPKLADAVELFGAGLDTAEIAQLWQVTEAQVYNLLARRKRVDTKP